MEGLLVDHAERGEQPALLETVLVELGDAGIAVAVGGTDRLALLEQFDRVLVVGIAAEVVLEHTRKGHRIEGGVDHGVADLAADDVVLAPIERAPLDGAGAGTRIEMTREGVDGLVVVVVTVEDGESEFSHDDNLRHNRLIGQSCVVRSRRVGPTGEALVEHLAGAGPGPVGREQLGRKGRIQTEQMTPLVGEAGAQGERLAIVDRHRSVELGEERLVRLGGGVEVPGHGHDLARRLGAVDGLGGEHERPTIELEPFEQRVGASAGLGIGGDPETGAEDTEPLEVETGGESITGGAIGGRAGESEEQEVTVPSRVGGERT